MLINTKIKCFIYDSLYVLCKILLTILKAKINFICMVKFKNYQPKKKKLSYWIPRAHVP